jgi:hypothetical protein
MLSHQHIYFCRNTRFTFIATFNENRERETYPLLTDRDLRSRLDADLQRRRKKASCVRVDTITTAREILCQRHWCETKGHMISSLYLI